MCSRRREGVEQETHERTEESEGAKIVYGPDQAAAEVESLKREGAAVASSLKPRRDRIGARSEVWGRNAWLALS